MSLASRSNIEREESPTDTEWLQESYRREFSTRFRKLRGVMRETISENDALNLREGPRVNQPEDMEAQEEFQFTQEAAKQVAFYQLIRKWIDEGILEPLPREDIIGGNHYTAAYVSGAYKQGLDFANDRLVENGIEAADEDVEDLVSRPIHIDTLEILYTRNYSGDAESPGLRGITDDLDRTISETFVEAIARGWHPRKAADEINEEIRNIQRTRARTMARSEMLHAHNKSALNRYREWDVAEVDIINHEPCPEICAPIVADAPYPIEEVPLGGPPFHPNCVGSVAPVV